MTKPNPADERIKRDYSPISGTRGGAKDALVHIEDKAFTYREVLHVLKPGGVFVAADWLWSEGAEGEPRRASVALEGAAQVRLHHPQEADQALREASMGPPG